MLEQASYLRSSVLVAAGKLPQKHAFQKVTQYVNVEQVGNVGG
jgi:hypothetical protein